MPKKKANGYFMFMQEERKRIQAETKQKPSMQEMANLCNEAWKRLSVGERAKYNAMAKQIDQKGGHIQNPDLIRLDNHGQIISLRKSAVQEALNTRTREKQLLIKSWEEQNILDIPFHLISFQVMYTEEPIDYYLPLEIGLVAFTLREGIIQHLHRFIDAGDVPHGNMHLALKHSENTHKIPLNFKEADSNLLGLWTRIVQFVESDSHTKDAPPIFCLLNERTLVESSLDYIHFHARSGEPNPFTKIYALEDLVMSLLLQSGKFNVKPSETQIHDSLLRNQWDYISSIRCSYHDEQDCSYCSLAIVRRLSFAVFDILACSLEFKLGKNHMPDESSNQQFTVKHPSSYGASRTNTTGAGDVWCGTARHRSPSPPRSPSPSSSSSSSHVSSVGQPRSSGQVAARVWGSSRDNQVEVKLSDSDSDDDSCRETKSTSEQYVLEELRRPKNIPMVSMSLGMAFGRGLTLPHNSAVTPGHSQNQVRQTAFIRPPPGFGPRPGCPMLYSQSLPRPKLGSAELKNTVTQRFSVPNLEQSLGAGFGRGLGRGRGMPPQVLP